MPIADGDNATLGITTDDNTKPTVIGRLVSILNSIRSGNPGADAFAVAPSDTVNFTTGARALYVGVTGDVTAQVSSGAVLFKAVPAGTILPIQCTRVNATGTTATNITGLV